MPNNSPEQKNTLTDIAILCAIIVTGSVLIILGTWKYGVGLTGDSISYIALAKNILKDFSFNDISGEPFVLWPPGYSLSLAFISYITSVDVYEILLPYNLVCYAVFVISAWVLIRKRLTEKLILYPAIGVLALAPAVFRIFTYALADVVFLPLSLLFFVALERMEKRKTTGSVVAVIAVAALLPAVKYTGIIFLPFALLAIVKNFEGRKGTVLEWAAILAGSLPFILVLGRNYQLTGTLTGYRGSSLFTLPELILQMGLTLGYWVFPAVALLIMIAGWVATGKGFFEIFRVRIKAENRFLAFTILYLVAVFAVAALQAVDEIDNRLLIPVFVPLFILFITIAELTLKEVNKGFTKVVVTILLLAVPAVYARTDVRSFTARIESGAGSIRSDEFYSKFPKEISKAGKMVQGATLYSNNPAVLYYLTGLPSKSIPMLKLYNSDETSTRSEALGEFFKGSGRAFILIMTEFMSYNHYTIEEIGRYNRLKEEARGPGWVLFSVLPQKPAGDSND